MSKQEILKRLKALRAFDVDDNGIVYDSPNLATLISELEQEIWWEEVKPQSVAA